MKIGIDKNCRLLWTMFTMTLLTESLSAETLHDKFDTDTVRMYGSESEYFCINHPKNQYFQKDCKDVDGCFYYFIDKSDRAIITIMNMMNSYFQLSSDPNEFTKYQTHEVANSVISNRYYKIDPKGEKRYYRVDFYPRCSLYVIYENVPKSRLKDYDFSLDTFIYKR